MLMGRAIKRRGFSTFLWKAPSAKNADCYCKKTIEEMKTQKFPPGSIERKIGT